MFPFVISPGGLVGELGGAYLRQLARGAILWHNARGGLPTAPSSTVYFQVIRGMCLQVYLYAPWTATVSGRPQPTMANVLSRPGVAPILICSTFLIHAAARPTRSPSVRPRHKADRR